ncbi:MAG: hypothetical protein Q4C47_02420 [Planctomycetia bacterium]|nr:hypothetical protein [Planctomycetia bacterium]
MSEAGTPITTESFDSMEAAEMIRIPLTVPAFRTPEFSAIHTERRPPRTHDGPISRTRLVFRNTEPGSQVTITDRAMEPESRHPVETNSSRYIRECHDYLNRTGDVEFLRRNIDRMRRTMEFSIRGIQVEPDRVVAFPETASDNASGRFRRTEDREIDGEPCHETGVDGDFDAPHGTVDEDPGNLFPFRGMDCLTVIYHYDHLRSLTELERQIDAHPEWNIPTAHRRDPESLMIQARNLRRTNSIFLSVENDHFVPFPSRSDSGSRGIRRESPSPEPGGDPSRKWFWRIGTDDVENVPSDDEVALLNLKAIRYGYANERQSRSILEWIHEHRITSDYLSMNENVYHGRFASVTTAEGDSGERFRSRHDPQSQTSGDPIPGDGDAADFLYYDLMAEIRVNGADEAAKRFGEIVARFDGIRTADGQRKYHDDPPGYEGPSFTVSEDTGISSREFSGCSALARIVLDGFAGFTPHLDGFDLEPRHPSFWRSFRVDRVVWQNQRLTFRIFRGPQDRIDVTFRGPEREIRLRLPVGDWCISEHDEDLSISVPTIVTSGPRGFRFTTRPGKTVRFTRSSQPPEDVIIDADTVRKWSEKFRNWTYHPGLVIDSEPDIPGYEDFHSTDCPTVFQLPDDPKWYMSFIAFNGKGYNTFVVESDDLIRWTNPRLLFGFGPEGEFDHGGRVLGAYLYESWNIDAPRTLKKLGDRYWSLYGCYPLQGGYELRPGYEGVAISRDGFTWERAQQSWILSIHEADRGSWEQSCIYQPWLVVHKGVYYNFYNAADGDREQTGLAFSDDLLDWKRYPGNPIVPTTAGGYNDQFSSDPKVYHDETEDHWTMFFFGVGQGGAHIMVAFSRDLLHWYVDPDPIYRAGGHPDGIDSRYAHKTSLVYDHSRKTWFLYYCATGTCGRGIGLLTSGPRTTAGSLK